MKINVLNAGFVQLISYMQPVPQISYIGDDPSFIRPKDWTGDLEVVRNARVSRDADWRMEGTLEHQEMCLSLLPPMSNGEQRPCNCVPVERSDRKLIRRMTRKGHNTPFESMVFTFEVKAPIFVFRQWHRHRTWSYNEQSARYAEMKEEYYVPRVEHIGTQSNVNRQSRNIAKIVAGDIAEKDRQERIVESYDIEAGQAHQRYRARIEEQVPRELARINLPLSTYSRMFATVDLHNLLGFIRERSHVDAQWEIQQYSHALVRLVQPICPISVLEFLMTLNPEEYPGLIERDTSFSLPGE